MYLVYSICFNFQPRLALVFYWKTKQTGTYSLQSGFPTFFDCTISDGRCLYGLPSFEYPNLFKVSILQVLVNCVSPYKFSLLLSYYFHCARIHANVELSGSPYKKPLAGVL